MKRPETDKARENFGPGHLPRDIIRAMAEVKLAAVRAAQKHDRFLPDDLQASLDIALQEIAAGHHDEFFALPLAQGGAGTSINMIINETASALTLRPEAVDPIETVNRYQSTNDVFSTAVTIMTFRQLEEIEQRVIRLQETLVELETRHAGVLMTGRTEMQDGLPMTAGQLFGSWAGAVQRDRWRLHKLTDRLRFISLGGTAIGTCFNAPAPYVHAAETLLRDITGLPLSRSQNLPDEIAHTDKFSELASGYRLLSETLVKITGDLLYLSSGPVGEISHPNVQYGSSIMAAKTNPVFLELVRGLAFSVQGEALKISLFVQNGQLQLNSYLPFMTEAFCALHSLLVKALDTLIDRFFPGMIVNKSRMERNLVSSPALLNSLLPLIGYHRIKELSESWQSSPPASLDEAVKRLSGLTGINESVLLEAVNRTTLRITGGLH